MVNEISFEVVKHYSDNYWKTVALRTEILRKPLGLRFSDEELANEYNSFHLAIFEKEKLLACLILLPIDNQVIKMRQVAVSEKYQNFGLGKKLVAWSEKFSIDKQFQEIILHARLSAVPFYQKLGYQMISDEFLEVGLPHYKMNKNFHSSKMPSELL